jgi:acetylornithine/succinyldiaminopimelate/putrescine aminotransferase
MSTDPESRGGFGPYLANVGPTYADGKSTRTIRYGEIEGLKRALELHGPRVAGFLVEPIQGEAGFVRVFHSLRSLAETRLLQYRRPTRGLPRASARTLQAAQRFAHLR